MPRPPSTAVTIVAKLSSVRIMSAASFVTSVPVIPIATPMSARLSAGASLTPSPVIATTLPLRFSMSTSRTLSSGATRATTPISSTCASSSSSLSAANSVPVSARPSIPSWRRDRGGGRGVVAGDHADADPRLLAARDRVPRLLARRVDDRRRARAASGPAPASSRSPSGSNAAGRCRARPTASTRSPSPASRSFSARTWSRPLSTGTVAPSASRIDDERASRTSGAPLTKQRTTLRPSLHLVERRHQLVLGVERHLGDARDRRAASRRRRARPSRRARRAPPRSGRRRSRRRAPPRRWRAPSAAGTARATCRVSPATRRIFPSVE